MQWHYYVSRHGSLLVVGGMEMVWLRQQAWLMQAVVVDLHVTSLFIIITRCRRYEDGVTMAAGVANAGRGPACDVAVYYYYSL